MPNRQGGGVEIETESESLFSDGILEESISVQSEEQVDALFTDSGENSETQGIFTGEETEPELEILSSGTTEYAKDIQWNNTSDAYWKSIDWTTVNWKGVDWAKIPDASNTSNRVDWSKIDWSTIEWYITDSSDKIIDYLNVMKVDWSKVDWSAVDWSDFWNWQPEIGAPVWPNEDIFNRAVDWSKVNWDTVGWNLLDIDKVAMGNNGKGWENVDWSKVNWQKVYWQKIKALIDKKFIDYTIEFPNRDAKNNTITTVFTPQAQYFLIPSEEVKITVMNPAAGQGATHIVPSSAYRVYVDSKKQHVESIGDINATIGYRRADIFSASDKKILLQEALPALDDASYWDIEVDDSKCSFAVRLANRIPKVTIQSVDGKVTLEEGKDFTVSQEEKYRNVCKDYKLRIYPVKTSTKISGIESSAGFIKRSYTMHFSNLADYYNLKGIKKEIKYGDSIPIFTIFADEISENVYLEQKNADIGDLPKTTDSDYKQLWYGYPYLKIEYRYDGENWLSVFDWDDWKDKHISDFVEVRVSVASTNSEYYDGTSTERYLQGSIYSSFKVSPYSLNEVNTGMPRTEKLSNGDHYMAIVNAKETPSTSPNLQGKFDMVEDQGINDVTYTGQIQEPQIPIKFYWYTDWTVGALGTGYAYSNKDLSLLPRFNWKDNIDAGTASVEIQFLSDKGDFSGSIFRSFEILPKDIADSTTINVEAVDFVYDGKEHQPKLIIHDSEAGALLQENKDYTVTTVPDKPTNPGTIDVTIEGMGNYKGKTSASYKIINTSSGTTIISTIGDGSRYDISVEPVTYNGKAQLPEITVTNIASGAKLKAGTDYKVEAAAGADNTNAGLGKVKITGITISGSVERSFIIKAKPLDDTIQTEASDVTYNGKAQLPQVTVTDTALKASLAQEKDFILYAGSGADNINVGTGIAVIRGMGNYTGTKDISFKIAEAYQDEDGNTHYADGSIQAPDGSYLKPGKVMISLVKAQGNRVSIYLSGEARGARGYDYVIGTSPDMLKTKKYYRVNKDQMNIFTNMYYVGKGTYYAACHAWARGADGKKKFGPWSELKEFSVTAVTPQTPKILSTKINGSTVTVTYSKCRNAAGYDIVLGTARKKQNGEMRPVNYGTLVKKNINKDTLTVTFKNVPKGVYFAGLHAYNLTGPGETKVFSWWSDTKRIKV